ncbi:MAG: TIGR01777 family oxidoreductase [Microscillaceae bacterium]|nr:TIGR01777 family oxidoreductase [Microscillaceae bacterium]
MKKIIIPGGSGFLGKLLAQYFVEKGYEVVIFSRNPKKNNQSGAFEIYWDGKNPGDWQSHLEGAELLVNLAGRSVNCRYTQRNKAEILNSRIHSTQAIGSAILACKTPPKLWINSSSATIYTHNQGQAHDEYEGIRGSNFSENVCKEWEKVFDSFETPQTRKVLLRLSIVMGKNGGALPVYTRLVKWGLGGAQSGGKQYISWIHESDFCRLVDWFNQHPEASGVFNGASPYPIKNQEFMQILRKIYGMPIGLAATRFMLEVGALFIGTETELVLKSRCVVSKRLSELGFSFEFPEMKGALENLKQHT